MDCCLKTADTLDLQEGAGLKRCLAEEGSGINQQHSRSLFNHGQVCMTEKYGLNPCLTTSGLKLRKTCLDAVPVTVTDQDLHPFPFTQQFPWGARSCVAVACHLDSCSVINAFKQMNIRFSITAMHHQINRLQSVQCHNDSDVITVGI